MTIANAIGNGVADDKLIYTYVPDLIRYYLGEEPLLDNVESYRLDDPDVLDWVLGSLDQLVLKPVDGAGGAGIVIGPHATGEELAALRPRSRPTRAAGSRSGRSRCPPRPTLVGEKLAPRHIDLRPFAVNDGNDVWVLPGGLTRVALPEGELMVNSSQGGGSKDTWVLDAAVPSAEPSGRAPGEPAAPALPEPAAARPSLAVTSRPAERPRPVNDTSCSAGSRRRSTGPAATWSGPTTPRASSTCTCTGCSARPGADSDAACRALFGILGRARRARRRSWTSASCCSASSSTRTVPSAIAGLDARRAGRRARHPRGHLQRDVGVPERHRARPGRPETRRRAPRPARLPAVRQGTGGAVLRPGRLHDEPRRRVAVPRPRPQPGARRHDRTAAAGAHVGAQTTSAGPVLLRACGAHESFIRTHGWAAEPARVAEFLLLDRLFPRSVVHALATAEECLAALSPGPVRAGRRRPGAAAGRAAAHPPRVRRPEAAHRPSCRSC